MKFPEDFQVETRIIDREFSDDIAIEVTVSLTRGIKMPLSRAGMTREQAIRRGAETLSEEFRKIFA